MLEIERKIVFCYLRCWQEKFVVRWFYWSAQTIRVVSQIYREQNNRGDVSQSGNTDDTITDKTDWTIPILLSLIGLFVVVIWNGKGKYLWMKLLLAFSLNWNFFLRNRKKEKKWHSDYRLIKRLVNDECKQWANNAKIWHWLSPKQNWFIVSLCFLCEFVFKIHKKTKLWERGW